MERLLIIDGNSIANRAFYGIRPLSNKDGVPTNAIYGFLNIMLKTLESRNPDYLCVAFDLRQPTFRHQQYARYKAQRKKMPEDLAVQLPLLQDVLKAMQIPCLTAQGFEADDVIGTVSVICKEHQVACEILTGDKDDLQLINNYTSVLLTTTRMGNTETEIYTEETVQERYGLRPLQIIDLKGLMGDASDNIPGVRGVGEKTALSLLHKYGSVETLYQKLEEDSSIKGALREKLTSSYEDACLSKQLATIVCTVPLEFELADATRKQEYLPELYPLLQHLELYKLIDRLSIRQTLTQDRFEIIWMDAESFLKQGQNAKRVSFMMGESGECVLTFDGSHFAFFDAFPQNLLTDALVLKETHNAYRAYLHYPQLEGVSFDTELAAYLLDALSGNYPISRIAEQYLHKQMGATDEKERLAEECAAVFCLVPCLKEALEQEELTSLFSEMELPLARVLADMHTIGIGVDCDTLVAQGEELARAIEVQADEIYEMVGEPFNINSPKQLGTVLFEKLGLPAGKKTKSGYSTGAEILEKLRFEHPIVGAVLNYRQMMKLKSTYIDGLLPYVHDDWRIHTQFHQTVTATGRLSSTEPNLQNIPVRTEAAKKIRKAFVADTDYLFLSADYSQIELRILAHISGDEKMIAAFSEGTDIHTRTAALIFNIPVEAVTPTMRSSAKAINFGILYGMGEFSLGNDLGISRRQAGEYIENYLNTYPKVRAYLENVVEEARKNGFVKTLYGRKRPMPELAASNFITRSFGERVAKNAPIQGTAADIIKIAMIRVWNRLKQEKLKSRLILQVHDELILEVAKDEETLVTDILVQEMEGVAALSVPLPVSVSKAKDWYQL